MICGASGICRMMRSLYPSQRRLSHSLLYTYGHTIPTCHLHHISWSMTTRPSMIFQTKIDPRTIEKSWIPVVYQTHLIQSPQGTALVPNTKPVIFVTSQKEMAVIKCVYIFRVDRTSQNFGHQRHMWLVGCDVDWSVDQLGKARFRYIVPSTL